MSTWQIVLLAVLAYWLLLSASAIRPRNERGSTATELVRFVVLVVALVLFLVICAGFVLAMAGVLA